MSRLGRQFPNNRFTHRRAKPLITMSLAGHADTASSAKATSLNLAMGLAGHADTASSARADLAYPHVASPNIADILAGLYGQVRWSIRWELLDGDSNLTDVLHPSKVGNITWDPSNRIQRILDGVEFDPVERVKLTRGVSRIRPIFEIPDAGYEHALGVFTWFGGSKASQAGGDWETGAPLWDRCYQLDQKPNDAVGIAAATQLTTAAAGIAGGGGIPTGDLQIVTAAQTLGAQPLAWPIGSNTTRLAILRQLASLLGYLPPGFSQADKLVMRPVPQPDDEWPTFVYVDGENAAMTRDTLVESTTVADRPNTYIVLSASSSPAPLVGTFRIPSSFENSESAIGFAIVATKTIDGFSTQAQVDAAAKAWAQQDYAVVRIWEWETGPEPTHDQWDIVEIDDGTTRERGLEFWHQLDCNTGKMKHRAKKVYLDAALA